MSDELRDQINQIIRHEIQGDINEYLDQEEAQKEANKAEGFRGFVSKDDDAKELKVNIPNQVVDEIIKEYKKIKKFKKSNLGQVKKLGLVDRHGNPL